MTTPAPPLALILGANGGIGHETAAALARHGWRIRAFAHRGRPADGDPAWDWLQGDALDADAVARAAQGARIILHAVNPPGYRNWATLVLPMIRNTLRAARESGARILLPGTVYNYDPGAFPVLREDTPQTAVTHKGRIRIALEASLEEAAASGVRSLIVRFGDFFGPRPGNSWFSQGIIRPGVPLTRITYPGRAGVGHAWAYLPDAGEVFAALADREEDLEPFARFHFRGHWDPDGTRLVDAIRRAAGNPTLPVSGMPWLIFRIGSLFNETMRELHAVRPLWETPVELDNTKLLGLLGEEPRTPLQAAVEASLKGMGALA